MGIDKRLSPLILRLPDEVLAAVPRTGSPNKKKTSYKRDPLTSPLLRTNISINVNGVCHRERRTEGSPDMQQTRSSCPDTLGGKG